MHSSVLAAMLAVLLCAGGSRAQEAPQPVNPGFETDTNDDGLPDNWGRYISHGTARTALDREVRHGGEASLRIELDAESRCTVSQLAPIAEPGTYTFGCRLKTDLPPGGNAHVYVQWRGDDGAAVRNDPISATVTGESDWTEVTALATKPEEARAALLVIVVQSPEPGVAWADDAYLVAGAHPVAPPAVQPGALLRNPGFEEGDEQPVGWSQAVYGDGFTLSRDDTQARSGVASARLEAGPNPGSRACFLQTSAPFRPEKGLRLRFWYRGTGSADGILRFRPAPGVEVEGGEYGAFSFRPDMPQDDWTEYVYETALPLAAREAGSVRAEIILYQRAEGVLWYDDVSIESLEEWQARWRERPEPLICPNRPADGRTVLQNPPDFSWHPQADAVSYSLQLSPEADFPPALTIDIPDLPHNVYSHHETLGEGAWHWRVRYDNDAGEASGWSPARAFTITADAMPFPVPPAEELLARIPQGHPRMYATAETLEEFRAPMQGSKQQWGEAFRRSIDNLAEREVSPEPPADWLMGAREGPLTDEIVAVGGRLRSYCSGVMGRVQQLAFGYLLSGETKYADAAIAQMLEVATWDPSGVTSYRNHDQVFREIAYVLAMAYDWCHDRMTPEQRTAVADAIIARAGVLYHDFALDGRPITHWPYDSHGISSYGFLGICAIALAHDTPEGDEWFRFVAATYPAVFPPWGGEEGGWGQGVAYWKWSQSFAWWFFDALDSATGFDLYQKAWQRNNGWYKPYMHPPWCSRHHFGDQNHGTPDTTDQLNMARLAKRFDNPYFQWYAKSLPGWPSGGIFGYWWHDEDLPWRPPADIPQGAYFADIGWVAMHSDLSDPDDIMLMFKSSPFGSFNHSHADQNSFVLYAFGEPLLIDSGYYDWYGSPHDVGFSRQTKAHNCVLVNGEGQPIFDKTATGEITAWFQSPHVDYTCGDATVAYKGKLTRFRRHILYLRPDVFLIYDDLEAPEPSTFTWCLHAEEEMQVDAERNEVVVSRGGAKALVKFITPQGLEFEQTDQFTPPPTRDLKDEWHVYATTTEPATQMRFITLIRPFRADEPEDAVTVTTVGEAGVSLGAGDEPHTMLHVGPLSLPNGLSRQAALSVRAPGVEAVVDGTLVADGGRSGSPRLRASTPVTAAIEYADPHLMVDMRRIWVSAQEPVDLSLKARGPHATEAQPVTRVTLNGKELGPDDWRLEPPESGSIMLVLSLPPGDHVIEVNPEEPEAPRAAVTLTLDGRPLEVDAEAVLTQRGEAVAWGGFAAPPGPAMVERIAPGARVHLGRERVEAGKLLWLGEENALTARAEALAPVTLALRSLLAAAEPLPASVVEEEAVGGPGVVRHEAEAFAGSGGGSARAYSHRPFLSGGQGLETAVVPGQWVEWEVEAPQAGEYHLVFKGAVHEANADRLIELNGAPLLGEHRLFRFPYTGGFGAEPGEWKHMVVCGEDGNPVPISLEAGTHRLRLITAERKINLDYLLLMPTRR